MVEPARGWQLRAPASPAPWAPRISSEAVPGTTPNCRRRLLPSGRDQAPEGPAQIPLTGICARPRSPTAFRRTLRSLYPLNPRQS